MKEKLKQFIKKDISAAGEDGGRLKLKLGKNKKIMIMAAVAVVVAVTAILKLTGGNEKGGG